MTSLQDRVERKRKNRKLRIKRMIAIMILLFIFLAAVGASYFWFGRTFGEDITAKEGVMVNEDKMTVMIMGVDRRADDTGRSDTLMVATVDPEKKAAAIMSIPRDTRVKIRGHGYDKINHAYAFGGHNLTKESVEQLLGTPINYYFLIDTKAFERIIDAIGGIDINVEKRMYYEDPWDDDGGLVIDLRPGQQHMDGKTAIQYVRYRDEEGDIGRISRQQKFIKAVIEKISTPSIITKLPTIIKEVNAAIETDMSVTKMISLIGVIKDAKENGLNTAMVPGKPAYISDVSYWLPDVVELRKTLAQILDVKMDSTISRAMEQEAQEYEVSIPEDMKIIESEEEHKKLQEKELKRDTEKNRKQDQDKSKDKDTLKENKDGKQGTAKAGDAKPQSVPSVIQVEVVNASGIDGAGAEVASILKRQGFIVTGVSTMTAPYKNTVVITNSSDEQVIGKFSALPFAYSIQVNQSDGGVGSATLVIGKDYRQ